MMTASPEHVDNSFQSTSEAEANLPTVAPIVSHLDEVIEAVVAEAVEYANKPREEQILPTITRKPPPQARKRPLMGTDFNQNRVFANTDGLNQMSFLASGTSFQQKLQEQFPSMVPFTTSQNAVQTAAQQQLMMHYNGQYQGQPQQQQYAQAAHFQALQNQQAQYQAVNAAALAQMQQLQRQQLQQRQQPQQIQNPNRHLLYSAVSTGSPSANPVVSNSPGAQQQALASAQQQLHQLYAAAHQLPGMMQTFPPVQNQPQQQQPTQVTVQNMQVQPSQGQPQICNQRVWTSAEQIQAAQQQQLAAAAAAAAAVQQQQQQYIQRQQQQQASPQQLTAATLQRSNEFQPYTYQQ